MRSKNKFFLSVLLLITGFTPQSNCAFCKLQPRKSHNSGCYASIGFILRVLYRALLSVEYGNLQKDADCYRRSDVPRLLGLPFHPILNRRRRPPEKARFQNALKLSPTGRDGAWGAPHQAHWQPGQNSLRGCARQGRNRWCLSGWWQWRFFIWVSIFWVTFLNPVRFPLIW